MPKDRVAQLEHQLLTVQRRLEEQEARAIRAEKEAQKAVIEGELRAAALQAGALPGAVPSLIAGAQREATWKLDQKTGQLHRQTAGVEDRDELGAPITPLAWMRKQKTELPTYYAQPPAQKAQKDGKPNPWTKRHWNLTQQSLAVARDINEARRLAADAGSSLHATQPPNA